MTRRCFIFVFAVALLRSTASESAENQAPAPSFKDGEIWQFNITRKGCTVSSTEFLEGTYELRFTQGNVKLYNVSQGQKSEIAITPNGRIQEVLSLIGKSEQQPDLKFPLSVGQKWTYEYQDPGAGGRENIKRSVEVNVTGIEPVTTPAGSFKAYKLLRTESWTSRGGSGGTTWTYFVSPETSSVVKKLTENNTTPCKNETELIKFTPGS